MALLFVNLTKVMSFSKFLKISDLILEKLFEPLEWIHRCFDVISPRSLFQQQKDTKCIRL